MFALRVGIRFHSENTLRWWCVCVVVAYM